MAAFGFYPGPEYWKLKGDALEDLIDSYASTLGFPPQLWHIYHSWAADPFFPYDGTFPNLRDEFLIPIRNRGCIPVVSWAPHVPYTGAVQPAYSWSAIVAGNHDAFLTQWATDCQAWGIPFILRFAWEAEHTPFGQSWNYNLNGNGGAASFIAMWTHVRNIFRTAGCTNAKWLWTPVALNMWHTNYPGAHNCDFIGWDAYTSDNAWVGAEWKTTLLDEFDWPYRAARAIAPQKGFIVGEYGCDMSMGADAKERWIRQGHRETLAQMPNIVGYTYFNSDWTPDGGWRMAATPRVMEAHRDAFSQPQFNGNCGGIQAPTPV